VDSRGGKDAETHFRLLARREVAPGRAISLIEARPITGRTHQIRVHLAESGHSVVGDPLYGKPPNEAFAAVNFPLGLRSVGLAYTDPFTRRRVRIAAPVADFLEDYGFAGSEAELEGSVSVKARTCATTQSANPSRR
jgi:23S rRNA-/tRNA-specific pseudouridylate synthase